MARGPQHTVTIETLLSWSPMVTTETRSKLVRNLIIGVFTFVLFWGMWGANVLFINFVVNLLLPSGQSFVGQIGKLLERGDSPAVYAAAIVATTFILAGLAVIGQILLINYYEDLERRRVNLSR